MFWNWFACCLFAVGVTLNCEKIVKLLHQRHQHRAGLLLAPGGSHGAAAGFAGLLQEGGGRQPGSQCDVLVCVRGRDGRLLVRLQGLACWGSSWSSLRMLHALQASGDRVTLLVHVSLAAEACPPILQHIPATMCF